MMRNEKLETLMEVLGGQLKKKALHTIAFTPEMQALAYIMIFNLYPMKNLTILSGPRTVFLYDLFTHKEIDICGHIYHLFVKKIKKRNARLILLFPSPVMSLILRVRVKIPSGLPVMQRENPISERTIFQSKAHIPGPSLGVSQILRDEAAKEGNTNEEIDWFTSVPKDTPQPSSQAQARTPDRLDLLLGRVEELHLMLASHINYSMNQFTYLQDQITILLPQIEELMQKSDSDSEFDAF